MGREKLKTPLMRIRSQAANYEIHKGGEVDRIENEDVRKQFFDRRDAIEFLREGTQPSQNISDLRAVLAGIGENGLHYFMDEDVLGATADRILAGQLIVLEDRPQEKICPSMSNHQFAAEIMEIKNEAIEFINVRIKDLAKWGETEKQRVARWFGEDTEHTRNFLLSGLKSCVSVLSGMTAANFVRYSHRAMRNIGCVPSGNKAGLAAEVCAPDIRTHTVGIGLEFCDLPKKSFGKDSKLSTLIHEVTHFSDTFASNDTVYYMRQSLKLAVQPDLARRNADSITGYVLYGD